MRNQRIGQELEIGAVVERERLRLRRVVGVHRVDLGRRLGGDVRARARPERHVERQPVALQHAARRGDHEHPRHVGQRVVAVQRALREVRRARCRDRPGSCARRGARSPGAGSPTCRRRRCASAAARPDRPRTPARQRPSASARGRRRERHARSTAPITRLRRRQLQVEQQVVGGSGRPAAGMPSPVLQLVNRNGLSPRISRESCSITSRLAPT